MTFSIAGRCAATGALGVAISSSSIAVPSRCVWIAPGTGVVLSQNVTDPRLGLLGLKLLSDGFGAASVLSQLQQARPDTAWRQLAVLDSDNVASWASGANTLGTHAGALGAQCVAVGNMLANDRIPQTMVDAFAAHASDDLPTRLLKALRAGADAGGEEGPLHSAGLKVCTNEQWPTVDLRVDWEDHDPVQKLATLWALYEPQMAAYIQRSRDPAHSPSYGVPGNR